MKILSLHVLNLDQRIHMGWPYLIYDLDCNLMKKNKQFPKRSPESKTQVQYKEGQV